MIERIAKELLMTPYTKATGELPVAAWCNDLNSLCRCITEGADVHAYRGIALQWAAENRCTEAVEFLIEAGARWEDLKPNTLIRLAGRADQQETPWLPDIIRAMIPWH